MKVFARNPASSALALLVLLLPATLANADVIVTNWFLRSFADSTFGSQTKITNTSAMPLSTSQTAAAGGSPITSASDQFNFTAAGDNASIGLLFDHHRRGNTGADAESTGNITFTVGACGVNFNASGSYVLTGTDWVRLTVSLHDDTTNSNVFNSDQFSQQTTNQTFILGGSAGDQTNTAFGPLSGALTANHTYTLNYLLFTVALPVADGGASALGSLLLTTTGGATPPSITMQPTAASTCLGSSASFTVAANGSPLTYQWRRNTLPISGATNATITINPVTPADVGYYDCVVSTPCGSATSDTVALTVDTTPPIITATGTTLTLGCNPSAVAIDAALGTATATDDISSVTPTATTGSVTSVGCSRSQTRTWNATDTCGNAATPVSRTVTWTEDNTPPVIAAVGSTLILGCNPSAAAIEAALGTATASDNCGVGAPTSSDGPITGTCSKSQTRTWNVSDNCGNASTAVSRTVTWTEDTTLPAITSCPSGGALVSNPMSPPTCATVTAGVVASDGCGGAPTINCGFSDTVSQCVVTRTFTITATDACMNSSAPCTVVYTWRVNPDRPTVLCPASSDLGCNPTHLPDCDDVIPLITATDGDCGTPAINCVQNADTVSGCMHTRTFTITATDLAGGISDPCTVTYTWSVVTAPVFDDCTAGSNLGCNPATIPDCASAAAVLAHNECGSVTVNCNGGTDTVTGCNRSRTLTYSATACGLTSTCTRTYTWSVATAPVFDDCSNATVNLGVSPASVPTCVTAPAVHAHNECGSVSVSCSAGADSVSGCNYSRTLTYSASACGLTNSCTRTYTWTGDSTLPTITTCASGVTLSADASCRATVPNLAAGVVASDNCTASASLTRSQSPAAGTLVTLGTTPVTITIRDAAGNPATCIANVTVVDTTPPTLTVNTTPITVTDTNCDGTQAATLPVATATDNCDTSVTITHSGPTLYPAGLTTNVVFTATDDSGNSATRTVPVTVRYGASIRVNAQISYVSSGSHPHCDVLPLDGEVVNVYSRAVGSCARLQGGNNGNSWHDYPDIMANCTPVASGTTDADGNVMINVPPGEYIILSHIDTDGDNVADQYVSAEVGNLDCGDSPRKYLRIVCDWHGRHRPCKITRLTGSELLIVEPEYVVWDEPEQAYPFVFETEGEWGVTAVVSPPEGFIADHDQLAAQVDDEIEAVQFTITEVGSDFVPTQTTFAVRHKGQDTNVRSSVAIQLTPEYARSRGFDPIELRKKGVIVDKNPQPAHAQIVRRPAKIKRVLETESGVRPSQGASLNPR